jgi:hypothetical protein
MHAELDSSRIPSGKKQFVKHCRRMYFICKQVKLLSVAVLLLICLKLVRNSKSTLAIHLSLKFSAYMQRLE